jgi:hypothetical protein
MFGSLLNYANFLENVPWQPMLIAFVALAAGRRVPETLAIVVAWFAGYSLTWASKWAIAVAAGASWSDIFEVILFRLNGDIPGHPGYIEHGILAPTRKVLTHLYNQTHSGMLFLVLLPTLLPVRRPNLKQFALLSSPLLIPLAWFEILSNYSQIHAFLEYRTVSSCFGILIAAAIIASRGAKNRLAGRDEPSPRDGIEMAQPKNT